MIAAALRCVPGGGLNMDGIQPAYRRVRPHGGHRPAGRRSPEREKGPPVRGGRYRANLSEHPSVYGHDGDRKREGGLCKDLHYTLFDATFRTPRFWKAEREATEKALELLGPFGRGKAALLRL